MGLTALVPAGRAAEEKAAASTNAPSNFKDEREKASYSLGMNVGKYIRNNHLDLDIDTIAQTIRDMQAGKEPKLTDQQAMETMRGYQQEASRKTAAKNKSEGEEFFAENAKKPGVKSETVTLRNGTNAVFQYKVITEGTGAAPRSNDVVTVNYRGTLLNGKEFDSSAKRGQPGKFTVDRGIVQGWSEALRRMKAGSKWEIYLPSSLAYGDMGNPRSNPPIEPGATLIFEMELVTVEPPAPPPAPAQPLTSDIIKVPSAEELKKGAKIEVIKPEDAAKAAQEAQDKAKKDEKK